MALNIETLLEAANFLETGKEEDGKTRDRQPQAFHGYAKPLGSPATRERDHDDRLGLESGGLGGEDGSDKSWSPDGEDGGRRRAGGAGTREVHNKLEKNRRAHLKECFEVLKKQLPSMDDKKMSNLSILRSAFRYIQILKRKEKEFEQETQRLAREKIAAQERIAMLKRDLAAMNVEVDINNFIASDDRDTHSDTTATADNDSPIMSEEEEEDVKPVIPMSVAPPLHVISPPRPQTQMAPRPGPPQPQQIMLRNVALVNNGSTSAGLASPRGQTVVSNPLLSNAGTRLSVDSAPVTSTTTATATTASSPAITNSTTSGPRIQPFKTPVTQILQQTLQQRALQQQAIQQQQQLQQQLRMQQQQQQQAGTSQQVLTVQPGRPLAATIKPMGPLHQTVALNHLVSPLMAQGASILTATPAGLSTANAATVSIISQASALEAISKIVASTSSSSSTSPVVVTSALSGPVSSTGPAAPLGSLPSPVAQLASISLANLKHIITPVNQIPVTHIPATQNPVTQIPVTQIPAQIVAQPGQMSALSQLISQGATSLPRTSPATPASLPNGTAAQMVAPAMSQVSAFPAGLSSLGHGTPMTQLVSPMTLVSPTVQVSPGFSQTQLSTMLNNSVLKSLGQIPILQQPFSLSQVVRPVVMVTMPSVVTTPTTSTTTTVQVTVPVTQS